MSAKKERDARRFARSRERLFDQAFAKQAPWWVFALEKLMPMRDIRPAIERIFRVPLARWREKRARTNEAYKRRSLKLMARIARKMMHEGSAR